MVINYVEGRGQQIVLLLLVSAQHQLLTDPLLTFSGWHVFWFQSNGLFTFAMTLTTFGLKVIVPAHFHDVDGDLSGHNVVKIFGLSKILTVIWWHRA